MKQTLRVLSGFTTVYEICSDISLIIMKVFTYKSLKHICCSFSCNTCLQSHHWYFYVYIYFQTSYFATLSGQSSIHNRQAQQLASNRFTCRRVVDYDEVNGKM